MSGFRGFVWRIEFEGLALPLHALNTSLYHIALDALIGGLGGAFGLILGMVGSCALVLLVSILASAAVVTS